ncbi:MAG: hypothetical protein U1F11_06130 [Steroidobacteraceae bacterium]
MAAGVQVRLLVDGYGLIEPRDRSAFAAPRVGASRDIAAARHRLLRGAFNYRNHRKLVVADGVRASSAAQHGAQVFASEPDGSHQADLSLLIEGPAAAAFESVFLLGSARRQRRGTPRRWKLGDQGDGGCASSSGAASASGPDLPDDRPDAMFFAGICAARERIWIASPFYVLDDAPSRHCVSPAVAASTCASSCCAPLESYSIAHQPASTTSPWPVAGCSSTSPVCCTPRP